MKRVVWFACIWQALCGAQGPPPAARWPIAGLAVEGNRHYTAPQVLAVAGLKIGELAGKAEFDAAYDRLMACGGFEKVDYRFEPASDKKGYIATFRVVEVEPVYPVRFQELPVPDAEIEAALKRRDPLFGEAIPATAQVLARYTSSIEELLRSRGHEEKIAARLMPEGPDRFAVVFRPARNSPAIGEVSFTGNKAIPSEKLQSAFSGVGIGAPYSEQRVRELLDGSVRPLYDAQGYLRAAFPKISAQPLAGVAGVHVDISVVEGETYSLGGVQLDGAGPFSPAALLKTAGVKTGGTANFDEVKAGADRIRAFFRHNGYLRAETSVERRVNDEKKTVDLVIHIQHGSQFLFKSLAIQGLDLNGEAEIRRIWILKEGKPFDPDYPDHFLRSIREEGMFDNLKNTRSKTDIDEQARTVNVTLFFNK